MKNKFFLQFKSLNVFIGIIVLLGLILFAGCESEFIPENINLEPEFVVEGYIEVSDDALPPYVILTKSRPFFSKLDQSQLNDVFVKNAIVKVTSQNKTFMLPEFCLNDLPVNVRMQVAQRLGLNPDSLITNICAYIDINNQINPKPGQSYKLDISADDKKIEAITSIPSFVPLDSLWWREAPGKPNDTLLQLFSRITDPIADKNFYRYFCSVNGSEFLTPFNSVNDDLLINGKKFEFRLIKPTAANEDFDQATFGLFKIGDTITIKWATIDEGHFNFWNTYEFNRGNQGPFSSYTTINSNIKGGLGNWGGYHSKQYKIVVKR